MCCGGVYTERRLVTAHAKVVTQLDHGQRLTELQEQSEQRQLRVLQIAEEQLIVHREHNELLRKLLMRLVEHADVSSSTAMESTS